MRFDKVLIHDKTIITTQEYSNYYIYVLHIHQNSYFNHSFFKRVLYSLLIPELIEIFIAIYESSVMILIDINWRVKSKLNVRVTDIILYSREQDHSQERSEVQYANTPWKSIDKDLNESCRRNIKRLSQAQPLCVGPTGLPGKEKKDISHATCSTLIGNLPFISHSLSNKKI